MKKYLLFGLSALTVASFVACGTDNRSEQAAQTATQKEDPAKDEANKEDLATDAKTCTGGQPSLVTLGGVLWTKDLRAAKEDENIDSVDFRIRFKAIAGNDLKGEAGKVSENYLFAKKMDEPSKTILEQIEKASSEKTYLNLGCTDLEENNKELKDAKEIKLDLTSENKSVIDEAPKQIFICGQQEISAKLITLVSQEIIFEKDAELALTDISASTVSFHTEKLTLRGVNKITIISPDAVKFSEDTSGFNLNVIKTIDEDNNKENYLKIQTSGGSCIEDAPETAK